MIFGSEGLCHGASRSVRRWLGVTQGSLLLWNWVDFVHPPDRDQFQVLANTLQCGDLAVPFIFHFVGHGDRLVRIELRLLKRTFKDSGDVKLLIARLTRLREAPRARRPAA
jgi:PAS domain-containing protein